MPRALIIPILALAPGLALAAEVKLSGDEIKLLLPTVTVYGEGSVQTFAPGGTTDYLADGRPSAGYWRTSETQYCSQWPPFGGWTCYDVLVDEDDPERLIWVGDSGKPDVQRMERHE